MNPDTDIVGTHKLREQLQMRWRYGEWFWSYVVEGAEGAVEFHVTRSSRTDGLSPEYYGGVEFHYATPQRGEAPHHALCSCLSYRPCWHDGSSLMASERYIPLWNEGKAKPEQIFNQLTVEYVRAFRTPEAT